jgi:hypothetical protein
MKLLVLFFALGALGTYVDSHAAKTSPGPIPVAKMAANTYEMKGAIQLSDGQVHPIDSKITTGKPVHLAFGNYFFDVMLTPEEKNSVQIKGKLLKQDGKKVYVLSNPVLITKLDSSAEILENTHDQ